MEKKLASSQKIQDLCLEGINYLDSRTEFWRQQKPMYARKRDRMLQQQQWNRGKAKKQDMKTILRSIEEIDEGKYTVLVHLSSILIQLFFDSEVVFWLSTVVLSLSIMHICIIHSSFSTAVIILV